MKRTRSTLFPFLGIVVAVIAVWVTMGGRNDNQKKEPEMTSSAPKIDTSQVDMTGLDPENTLFMDVSTGGRVVIEMFPDKAPHHVARFRELTRQGFYDGVVFHRVIDGFMAQTGDPTGTGSGGSGQNIAAEFNDIHHERGIVSTARAASPDSADSQFFVMLAASPHLDGKYTVWGRVVSGMDYIDAIRKGPSSQNGVVEEPRDYIVHMQVAADAGD